MFSPLRVNGMILAVVSVSVPLPLEECNTKTLNFDAHCANRKFKTLTSRCQTNYCLTTKTKSPCTSHLPTRVPRAFKLNTPDLLGRTVDVANALGSSRYDEIRVNSADDNCL